MKPTLKALGNKRSKLKCDDLLSKIAFNFNLRRYISYGEDLTNADLMMSYGFCVPRNPNESLPGGVAPGLGGAGVTSVAGLLFGRDGLPPDAALADAVGWCRLTLSNPC